MTEKEQILAKLEPLIQQAEREEKWLESTYQCIPFSPAELRKEHANGKFIWGISNWRLIDPRSLLKDPVKEADKVAKHNAEIQRRAHS